ncbi:hypothetical protein [Paracoccus sanguinis]|nr:hypothetical protein [Paracoccus sanguinis]
MDPITGFLVGMGMQVIGWMFMPKPEKPKPPSLEDYEEPTADSARPIPVVFGTVEVSGLNILWWGDKSIRRRDVKPPGGKK